MNRRDLTLGLVAGFSVVPLLKASATDVDVLESPIMPMFRMMPARSGPNGFDFPITTGVNHWLQKQVVPENPDMYWDPVGEDYRELFGFHHNAMLQSGYQDDVALWNLDVDAYSIDATIELLQKHGWEVVHEAWPLLHFAANAEQKTSLVESLNDMGHDIAAGGFDWIAFPNDNIMVVGSNEALVHTVADRVATYAVMTTIDTKFHGLRYVLRPDTYIVAVQPAQVLAVQGASSTFISKSWTSNIPIVSSVGVRLDDVDEVQPLIDAVHARIKSETSTLLDVPYSEIIEIGDIQIEYTSVRIDFIPNTLDWDIFLAVQNNDYGMLPPA